MMEYHDTGVYIMKKARVAEATPVQVYLTTQERHRLERLARQLDTTRSEVLRRGLKAVERELLSPLSHPALRIIGLVEAERAAPLEYDPATGHDRLLTDAEEASWGTPTRRRRRGAR